MCCAPPNCIGFPRPRNKGPAVPGQSRKPWQSEVARCKSNLGMALENHYFNTVNDDYDDDHHHHDDHGDHDDDHDDHDACHEDEEDEEEEGEEEEEQEEDKVVTK